MITAMFAARTVKCGICQQVQISTQNKEQLKINSNVAHIITSAAELLNKLIFVSNDGARW